MVYAETAPAYRERGWLGVLPLPENAKFPPPSGYTGSHAPDPTQDQITRWAAEHPSGNVALRMPPHVIGLDVDAYGAKAGGETLAAAREQWGELPATWVSTARPGTLSGIRYYRVPDNTRFPGQLVMRGRSDVEIIQRAHRYAVAPPSLHPSGEAYAWYRPDGTRSDVPPHVDELPELPESWVAGLRASGAVLGGTHRKRDLSYDAAVAQLQRYVDAEGEPCPAMRERLDESLERLDHERSRHDAMVFDVMALAGMAHDGGHSGVVTALAELEREFIARVSGDRPDAQGEYDRALLGGLALLRGEPATEDACGIDHNEPSEEEISREYKRMRAREEATLRLNNRTAKDLRVPTISSTWELSQEVPEKIDWLVDGLIPRNGFTAISAEKKVGKSTILQLLTRDILDEGQFLGHFQCHRPHGNVVFFDLELSREIFGSYAARNGIARRDGVYAASLLGEVTNLNVTNPTHRASIAEALREMNCKLLIIDPIGPYLRMLNADEQDNTMTGRAVDALIALKQEAAVDTLITTHHSGHGNKTRARGASVLMDTPDVNVALYKQSEDSPIRHLRASGREVDTEVFSFTYDIDTGQLEVLDTGNDADARRGDVLQLLGFLEECPQATGNQLAEGMSARMKWSRRVTSDTVDAAEAAGFIVIERSGAGRTASKIHSLTDFGRGELEQTRRALGEDVAA